MTPVMRRDIGGSAIDLRRHAFRRLRIGEFDHRESAGELQRRLETVGEAGGHVGTHDNPVDDDVDIVLQLLVERRRIDDFMVSGVDLDALKTAPRELGEFFSVFALAPAHDRRQQIEARALRQGQHAIDHLGDGLAFDRQARRRGVRHADARPQQTHIIVDLGDRADSRARIFRGRLLLDGNGRREPVDLIDVGLLHHLQELTRIGGERLDVAALAFRIDRVERERGFAGARKAGEDDELVARNDEIDVFQIVLARAADRDDALVHATRIKSELRRVCILCERGRFSGDSHGKP